MVVSALIFVNVSGSQIPDVLKLALMLAGTAGFVAAGLICLRHARVRPAGYTFLAIGALLVPIDVVATYALFLRTSPFSSPQAWLWGSILGATVYAVLALRGYGSWYARAYFLAILSAVAAALRLADVGAEWWVAATVAVAIPHAAASRWTRGRASILFGPVLTPSRVVTGSALALMALGVLADALLAAGGDRRSVVLTVALATTYYALFFDRPVSRRLALVGAGLVAISTLYAGREPGWSFGLAFLALAVVYALGAARGPGLPPASFLPAATWNDVRRVAYAWGVLALVPVESYETATAAGAVAYLGAALLLVASSTTAPRAVYVGAVLLHAGVRYALLATGLIAHATRVAGPDGIASVWATAVFAGSLILLAAAAAPIRRSTALRDALIVAAVASAAAVVALGKEDPAHLALFATTYATLAVAVAVVMRRHETLHAAGLFAGIALLALFESVRFTSEYRSTGIALISLLLYAVALRVRAPDRARLARILREIAIGGGVLAVAAGASILSSRVVFHPAGSVLWQAITWSVLVLAALLAAEARVRRDYSLLVAGSATAVAAVLLEVAHFDPRDVQWYTTPVALYLIVGALVTLRYGPRRWAGSIPAIEAAGAVVLLAPVYGASWGRDGLAHGLRLVAESLVVLAVGTVLQRRLLAAAAVSFLVLAALRATVDLFDRLPNWVLFATTGALLLAVGFVLLLKRDLWLRAQTRVVRWWQGWEGPQGT